MALLRAASCCPHLFGPAGPDTEVIVHLTHADTEETMELLIIDFGLSGIGEEEHRAVCRQLAPAFVAVPGLVSNVWLADSGGGTYGGVYTFESSTAVDAFLGSELFAGVGAMTTLRDITVRRSACFTDRPPSREGSSEHRHEVAVSMSGVTPALLVGRDAELATLRRILDADDPRVQLRLRDGRHRR